METSILNTIKKMIGYPPEYTEFDTDIITLINGFIGTLTQLGVGPVEGYHIESSKDLWEDFIDDERYEMVKTYLFLKTKILFDPGQMSGAVLECYKEQAKEIEWRLMEQADPAKVFEE